MKTVLALLTALLGFLALSGCVVVPAYEPGYRASYYYDRGYPGYGPAYYRRGYYAGPAYY